MELARHLHDRLNSLKEDAVQSIKEYCKELKGRELTMHNEVQADFYLDVTLKGVTVDEEGEITIIGEDKVGERYEEAELNNVSISDLLFILEELQAGKYSIVDDES